MFTLKKLGDSTLFSLKLELFYDIIFYLEKEVDLDENYQSYTNSI